MDSRFGRSTRLRILGWILVPLGVAMAGGFGLTSFVLFDQVSKQVDSQLLQEVQELEVLAQKAINPETGESYNSAKDLLRLFVARNVPSNDELIFVISDGQVLERSSGSLVGRIDRDSKFLNQVLKDNEPRLGEYESEFGTVRYIAVPTYGSKDEGYLVSVIFMDQRERPVLEALTQLTFLLLLALGSAIVLGWFVAGGILRPIRDLRNAARKIRDGNFAERIEVQDTNSELGGLANEFNAMLDRIKNSFDVQRRFIDDAGHELKTPLTIVRGHLDLVRGSSEDENSSLEIVRDEVNRMSRIVGDLQTLTKSNEPRFVKLELNSIAETIDEVIVKASGLAERNWQLDEGPDLEIYFDRQRIVQAMLQLVDNAIKHTNPGDSIAIGANIKENRVEFFVGDSGPGIPKDQRQRVTERFVRGDWTAQDVEGSGLGLAIVDAVAKAHGGILEITESPLGGAELRLALQSTLGEPIEEMKK